MVQEEIQAYLEQCQNLGYTFDQIKISLLKVGWSQADIEDSFKQPLTDSFTFNPVPPTGETKGAGHLFPARKRRAWPLVTLLVIVLLVVLTAVPVAFAEQGYLPFLSKFYRETPLPLLWRGTDDDLTVLTARLAQNVSQIKQASDTESTQITVQQADPTKPVTYNPFNFQGLTKAAAPTSSQSSNLYADVPSFGNIYPLTLSYDLTVEGTPTQAYLKLNLDLTNVLQKMPYLTSFMSTLKNQDSLELVVPDKNNLYLRSSLIPYLSSLDNNKWLAFPITTETASLSGNNSLLKSIFSQSNITKMRAILKKDLKDQGVVRKNNQALVLYNLDLDNNDYQSLLNILMNSQSASSNNSSLPTSSYSSLASGVSMTMKMQIWLDPSSALPKYLQTQINSSSTGLNLAVQVSSLDSFNYTNPAPIIQPSPDQTIPDGTAYLLNVYKKLFNYK
jgi:hypothetical protein